jgi:hypothetical protein
MTSYGGQTTSVRSARRVGGASIVVGQPDAIGHGRPAESFDGVVQPAEGRNARHRAQG